MRELRQTNVEVLSASRTTHFSGSKPFPETCRLGDVPSIPVPLDEPTIGSGGSAHESCALLNSLKRSQVTFGQLDSSSVSRLRLLLAPALPKRIADIHVEPDLDERCRDILYLRSDRFQV